MAENHSKKQYMARCYITLPNGEKKLWSEVNLKTGETKIFLPQEEADAYENRIMENIGGTMSPHIENHPESALWDKTS